MKSSIDNIQEVSIIYKILFVGINGFLLQPLVFTSSIITLQKKMYNIILEEPAPGTGQRSEKLNLILSLRRVGEWRQKLKNG